MRSPTRPANPKLLNTLPRTGIKINQKEKENKRTRKKAKDQASKSYLDRSTPMALEWVVLGYAAGAEAIMLLFLTLPGLDGLRRGLVSVVRSALKPMLSVVPFCLFLLMDIYWKYETRPTCDQEHACTPSEHLRHQKSIMKSQRNALLIAATLLLYWLLFTVTSLVVKIEQLNQRVNKLKRDD
ncbi:B-cell receptor-associated protein 31-like [Carex littledalei]|uniref:Endoplasmic reticulum transmembrane protein n=1 Tax=Carex littledalei TaxID=544730 RepID=A0A833QRE2_9POAL|nr:B-cell receptor-associated protein 31-like [Carex littledalei]